MARLITGARRIKPLRIMSTNTSYDLVSEIKNISYLKLFCYLCNQNGYPIPLYRIENHFINEPGISHPRRGLGALEKKGFVTSELYDPTSESRNYRAVKRYFSINKDKVSPEDIQGVIKFLKKMTVQLESVTT